MSRRRSAATGPGRRRFVLGLAFALAIPEAVVAAPAAPLPALELQSLEGAAVPRASYVRSGPWLLVYVMPFSGASQSLLGTLATAVQRGGPSITVVVGGSPSDAAELSRKYDERLRATWLADPKGASRAALGLKVLPAIVGVRDQTTHWTLVGRGVEGTTLRSVVVSWR